MNSVERVLTDELARLVDRLAASVPPGALEEITRSTPTLKARLTQAEGHLAEVRESLLEAYGRWRKALDDFENLWALVSWREAASAESVERATFRAA